MHKTYREFFFLRRNLALQNLLWSNICDVAVLDCPKKLHLFVGKLTGPTKDFFVFDKDAAWMDGVGVTLRGGERMQLTDLLDMWSQTHRTMVDHGRGRHYAPGIRRDQARYKCFGLQMLWHMLSLALVRKLHVLVVPQLLRFDMPPTNPFLLPYLMGSAMDMASLERRQCSEDVVIDYSRERFSIAAQWLRGQLIDIDNGTDDVIGVRSKNETLAWLDTMAKFASSTRHA